MALFVVTIDTMSSTKYQPAVHTTIPSVTIPSSFPLFSMAFELFLLSPRQMGIPGISLLWGESHIFLHSFIRKCTQS